MLVACPTLPHFHTHHAPLALALAAHTLHTHAPTPLLPNILLQAAACSVIQVLVRCCKFMFMFMIMLKNIYARLRSMFGRVGGEQDSWPNSL